MPQPSTNPGEGTALFVQNENSRVVSAKSNHQTGDEYQHHVVEIDQQGQKRYDGNKSDHRKESQLPGFELIQLDQFVVQSLFQERILPDFFFERFRPQGVIGLNQDGKQKNRQKKSIDQVGLEVKGLEDRPDHPGDEKDDEPNDVAPTILFPLLIQNFNLRGHVLTPLVAVIK
jgi:hypothetical protein